LVTLNLDKRRTENYLKVMNWKLLNITNLNYLVPMKQN
jgi:hypothetical protein